MRRLATLLATLIALGLAPTAMGMVCMAMGSGGLMIGPYQPLDRTSLDAQASFAIECFPAVPGEPLDLSVRIPSAVQGRLSLPSPQGGGFLVVQLYQDAARRLPLDEQSVIRFRDSPLIPTRYWVSVFARVPAGQDPGIGRYHLPLTVFITY